VAFDGSSNITVPATWNGGAVSGAINSFAGTIDTQTAPLTMGWSSGNTRWAHVLEANATYSLYAYNSAGGGTMQAMYVQTPSNGGSPLRIATEGYFHGRANGENGIAFAVGNDATINDIGVGHTLGINSVADPTAGGIRLGNSGPHLLGSASRLSIDREVATTYANGYRIVQGNYGSFWRNDGTTMYLMTTASGDPYGTWGPTRPFAVDLNSGSVSMGSNLAVTGMAGAQRFYAGWDSGNAGSMSCNNWFRSTGQTGWFSSDYGGGIYMTDTTYVQVYNGKAMKAAWFEVNGPVHNPQQYASAAAFRAYGNYGGGYGLIDGGAHISMYSVGGHLNFGFGTGAVAGKASIQSDGTFYGYDFAINSDRTMKKNIKPFRYNGRLRPVRFQWRADGSLDIGFIAQEVQKQYPEAVKLDEQTGKLRLTQSKLTAVVAYQVNAVEDEVIRLKAHVKRKDRQLAQALKSIKTLQRQMAKLMKK